MGNDKRYSQVNVESLKMSVNENDSKVEVNVDPELAAGENFVANEAANASDMSNVPNASSTANASGESTEVEENQSVAEAAQVGAAAVDQREEINQLQHALARARADFYNLSQQYSAYVRRSKEEAVTQRVVGQIEVCEALLAVLDDIEAARQHGELESGPLAGIATKFEGVLRTRFGLEKFGEPGQEFDPNSHEALMASGSANVHVPMVREVFQAGYRIQDRVLRPAKVFVENPE